MIGEAFDVTCEVGMNNGESVEWSTVQKKSRLERAQVNYAVNGVTVLDLLLCLYWIEQYRIVKGGIFSNLDDNGFVGTCRVHL